MEFPLLIPGISQKIDKLQKELKLVPAVSPQEFIEKTGGRSHRYSSVCFGPAGKKAIFYARLHKSLPEKERMKTEVLIARKLIGRKDAGILPRYFQAGIERDFEWIIREYLREPGLESKEKIEKLRRNISQKEIGAIAKGIYGLNHSFLSKFRFLKKFDISRYFDYERRIYPLAAEAVIKKSEAGELEELIESNRSLLKKENRYFCHGDFQIANVISFRDYIKIIDLESAHINNFAFDISFLFCRLWQEDSVRRSLIKAYFECLTAGERLIFPFLFRIDSFFNSRSNFLAKPSKSEFSASRLAERRSFFKKAMKKAIMGFEELIDI